MFTKNKIKLKSFLSIMIVLLVLFISRADASKSNHCMNDKDCNGYWFKPYCCSDFECNALYCDSRCKTNTCGKTVCAKTAEEFSAYYDLKE